MPQRGVVVFMENGDKSLNNEVSVSAVRERSCSEFIGLPIKTNCMENFNLLRKSKEKTEINCKTLCFWSSRSEY